MTLSHYPISIELKALGRDFTQSKWETLEGGRTNYSWRVSSAGTRIICKLFCGLEGNPLFPNNPHDEFAALSFLERSEIAPRPIQIVKTSLGSAVLYEYQDGVPVSIEKAGSIARTLGRLHGLPLPLETSFRRVPTSSSEIIAHAQAIIKRCYSNRASYLSDLQPSDPKTRSVSPVFVHGDLVPANIIDIGGDLKFIDWQCPALGDPCEDLSTFLSPAMQFLYADSAITDAQRSIFLNTYPNQKAVRRFEILEPLYKWRMVAYCLWQIENGKRDYEAAFEIELASIEENQSITNQ